MCNRYYRDSSIVIAALALAWAIWQGSESRKHDRLSVRPRLDFDVRSIQGEPIRVWFENQGLGPAIVRKLELVVDGNRRFSLSHHSGYEQAFSAVGIKDPNSNCLAIGSELCFAPGKPRTLIEFSKTDSESRVTILQGLSRIRFSALYESMYGESFEVSGDLLPGREPRDEA